MKYLPLILLLISTSINAEICWDAPTEREDNTSFDMLTEGAFYKMYFGETSGVYPNYITIDVESTCYQYRADTDMYAVMTTTDTDGSESQYSNETFVAASEPIPEPPKPPSSVIYTLPDGYQTIEITPIQ